MPNKQHDASQKENGHDDPDWPKQRDPVLPRHLEDLFENMKIVWAHWRQTQEHLIISYCDAFPTPTSLPLGCS